MSFTNDPSLLVNQLPESIEFTSDPRQNQEAISLMYKRTANAVNTKVGGLFSLTEQFNFQQYSVQQPTNTVQQFQNVYRKTFNLVALNGGNIPSDGLQHSFPHNIVGITNPTDIYGGATNIRPSINGGPMYMPIPYATNLINFSIEVWLDATNVNIVVGSCQWDLSWCVIVAEYLKT